MMLLRLKLKWKNKDGFYKQELGVTLQKKNGEPCGAILEKRTLHRQNKKKSGMTDEKSDEIFIMSFFL